MTEINGDGISLRHPCASEREGLMSLWTSEDVREYLGGVVSEDRAVQVVESIIEDLQGASRWSIRKIVGGEFVGLISLDPHHDGQDIEISFQLLPQFQSKGLASEALGLLLHHARNSLGINRLIAETQVRNQPSRRLLERHGFIPERELVRFGVDQIIYAKEL